jgi:hypothetical protein
MSSPKNSSQKLLFRDPRKYWGHLATSAWEKICNNFLCFGTPIFPSGASTQWKMVNNYIELIAKGHFGVASTTLYQFCSEQNTSNNGETEPWNDSTKYLRSYCEIKLQFIQPLRKEQKGSITALHSCNQNDLWLLYQS